MQAVWLSGKSAEWAHLRVNWRFSEPHVSLNCIDPVFFNVFESRHTAVNLRFGSAPRFTRMREKVWLAARVPLMLRLPRTALQAVLSAHVTFPPARAAPGLLVHALGHTKHSFVVNGSNT